MAWQLRNELLQVVDLPPIGLLPNCLVQNRVHKPMRIHTAGTILVRLLMPLRLALIKIRQPKIFIDQKRLHES